MTSLSSSQLILIGLPATGKTSFLAALWYLVQHMQVPHKLAFERLEGDNKYLNQISKSWLQCQPVPRTPTDSEKVVSMILKEPESGNTVALTFPDLSGESFSLQWTERQMTISYDDFLKTASGGVLFVTPEPHKPARIDAAAALVQEMNQADGNGDAHVVQWEATLAPRQVQLVELLQFIASRDYFKPPFRLALVISAWDKLKATGVSPAKWIAKEVPLLFQFLESNRNLFEYTIYGVSAQGGEYATETEKLTEVDPSERIDVVSSDGNTSSHDLTEPLLWLMR
jgi:Double-GTPase 1